MPVSVAEFAKAAEDSGILTADSLADYLDDIAPEADAAVLASRLVEAARLTAFQARQIYGGKARSLVLGPYLLLDVLGQGGMGCVYKAEHRTMRRVVALKLISKTVPERASAVRRFEREVQAAARLEHPNIVTAFDAGKAAGSHYLVMQFVEGHSLSEVVRELGPQPAGRAVDWILQAARGLAYAHGKGVVHRDIKPANLLVAEDGTVRILDMGLARLETLDVDQDQLTGSGQIMGTVDYMAPEQAMDTRTADARSDIYSLGVTLWYLVTGRPLFAGDTAMNKMMAHMHTPAPTLDSGGGEVSPELEAVFQRMVAKQPADRFQSMREVVAALDALARSEASPGSSSVADGAALSTRGTGAVLTIQGRKAIAAEAHTKRLGAGGVGADAGLRKDGGASRRLLSKPAVSHLALGAGAVLALLLAGLVTFALRGRREASFVDRTKAAASAAAARSATLDAVVHPTVVEPIPPSSTSPAPATTPFGEAEARAHQQAWAKHLGVEVETTNSIGQTLVLIPPGVFMMGDGDTKATVTLDTPFRLGQTEVTQRQWRDVMGTEPSRGKRYVMLSEDAAVTYVTWHDAVAFCRTLTEREHGSGALATTERYRLPTEAEWEWSCRAGTAGGFSFGDDARALGAYAWYGDGWDAAAELPIPGGNTATEQYAHQVGLKRPNPWGLFDVHGNVLEWVDGSHQSAFTVTRDDSPPIAVERQVCRGGSWLLGVSPCRSAFRKQHPANDVSGDLGFRIALTRAGDGPPHAAASRSTE